MDAQQTSEVFIAAELDSVNGGKGGGLFATLAGVIVDAVFDAVVVPIIRAV
jgi:hypothetical protein